MPPFKDFLLILCILLILQFLTCYYYSTPKFLHQNAFPFQFKRRKIHSASAPSSLHHSSLRNPYLFAPVIHPSADIETTISLSLSLSSNYQQTPHLRRARDSTVHRCSNCSVPNVQRPDRTDAAYPLPLLDFSPNRPPPEDLPSGLKLVRA